MAASPIFPIVGDDTGSVDDHGVFEIAVTADVSMALEVKAGQFVRLTGAGGFLVTLTALTIADGGFLCTGKNNLYLPAYGKNAWRTLMAAGKIFSEQGKQTRVLGWYSDRLVTLYGAAPYPLIPAVDPWIAGSIVAGYVYIFDKDFDGTNEVGPTDQFFLDDSLSALASGSDEWEWADGDIDHDKSQTTAERNVHGLA
jgi:hypothetical protein